MSVVPEAKSPSKPLGKLPSKPRAPPEGLDPLLLAGALCARLCHDLAGSLGALSGTLEMAAEDGDKEALRLAMILAQELAARLRLLRAAWGSGSDVPALESLLPGLPGAERLKLDTANFRVADESVQRFSLNLMMVAAAALPRGGVIRMSGTDQRLKVEIEGARAGWPEAFAGCLAGDATLLEACEAPRSIAIAMACLHARALGRCIALETSTRLTVDT